MYTYLSIYLYFLEYIRARNNKKRPQTGCQPAECMDGSFTPEVAKPVQICGYAIHW